MKPWLVASPVVMARFRNDEKHICDYRNHEENDNML